MFKGKNLLNPSDGDQCLSNSNRLLQQKLFMPANKFQSSQLFTNDFIIENYNSQQLKNPNTITIDQFIKKRQVNLIDYARKMSEEKSKKSDQKKEIRRKIAYVYREKIFTNLLVKARQKCSQTPEYFKINLIEKCRMEHKKFQLGSRKNSFEKKNYKKQDPITSTLNLDTSMIFENPNQEASPSLIQDMMDLKLLHEETFEMKDDTPKRGNFKHQSTLPQGQIDSIIKKHRYSSLKKSNFSFKDLTFQNNEELDKTKKQINYNYEQKLIEQNFDENFPRRTRNLSVSNQISVNNSVQKSLLEKSINSEGETKLNQYILINEIGRGSFGKVKLARTGKEYFVKYEFLNYHLKAIKIVDRKKLKKKLLTIKIDAYTMLEREIAIMKKLDHPNIVRLFEVIENPKNDKLYLVMEYMDLGSLLSSQFFHHQIGIPILSYDMKNPSPQKIDKEQARDLFRQFSLGLDYLHSFASVVHRDIKPENLLVNQNRQLKIADFGVSQLLEQDEPITSKVGTQAYLPPEIWRKGKVKGKPLDIWASGITLFKMIYGYHPFYSEQLEQLKVNVLKKQIDFEGLKEMDFMLVDLLNKMLCKNPEERITIKGILSHPWIMRGDSPLTNQFHGKFELHQDEIKNAITKLTLRMAIKTIQILQQSLNRSRQRIRMKEFQSDEEV